MGLLKVSSILLMALVITAVMGPGCSKKSGTPQPALNWAFDAKEAARRQDEAAKALDVPKAITLDLGDKVTMKLVLIPAGKFMMGSPEDEKDRVFNEAQHEVTITKPFYMGIYTATQEQYEQVMGQNPSSLKGTQNPVEHVSWEAATEFCKKLSQKTGKTVRLPTEAEWEYACRAGTTTPFNTGETISTDQANYRGYWSGKKDEYPAGGKTTPVGTFKPNAWGLYDMHGNVMQWCADRCGKDYYGNLPKADPLRSSTGAYRACRGGTCLGTPSNCRSAFRFCYGGDPRYIHIGFRVVVFDVTTPTSKLAPQPTSRPVAEVYTAWPFDAKEAARRQDETAKALGVSKEVTLDLGNTVTMKLVLIPAGKFITDATVHSQPNEAAISRPFYMGTCEVTQQQYEAVMGGNPSQFKGPSNPVECVSWDNAVDFCKKASKKTGWMVRLPDASEWQWASRAGAGTSYCTGQTITVEQANVGGKGGRGKTLPVGRFKPNAFGLYDVHGNVWELCDGYEYESAREVIPDAPNLGELRFACGGSVAMEPMFSGFSGRANFEAGYAGSDMGPVGFRVVVSVPNIPMTAKSAQVYTDWPFNPKEAARRQHDTAKDIGGPKELVLHLGFTTTGKGVTMNMVLIPAGRFMFGKKELDVYPSPPHEVTITRPFYIGTQTVTQEQYELLMGKNPSRFRGADNPVEQVTWEDAAEFCKRLSERIGKKVSLPTEAQWEYACRAGMELASGTAETVYEAHIEQFVHPPNAWGIDDLPSVGEWCADWFGQPTGNVDPKGPGKGDGHVSRGVFQRIHIRYYRYVSRIPGSADCGTSFRVLVAIPD